MYISIFLDPFKSINKISTTHTGLEAGGRQNEKDISRTCFTTMCMFKISNVDCLPSSTLEIKVKKMNEMQALPLNYSWQWKEKVTKLFLQKIRLI